MNKPALSLLLFLVGLCIPTLSAQSGQADLPCPLCPALVTIPPGSFTMGDPSGRLPQSTPMKRVSLAYPLAVTRTEVTFDQWQACVAEGGCPGGQDDHGWGRGSRPIIKVSWDEARTYTAWLSRKLGRVCRLPSEAEWEYVARAGTTTAFWWGDKTVNRMASCRDCFPQPPYGTVPAGSLPANPWGLHEVAGNVWEWTADCWTPSHADQPGDGRPVETGTCRERVIKGGSWYYFSPMAQSAARSHNDADQGSYNIGLRVVCEMGR